MTTSCWPSSQSRSAAQKPADPVPTTTVFAVTTGTSRPPIVTDSGSGLAIVCSVVSSQGGDVHAAVDVEDLPGGVRRLPRGEHGDRTGHIGRPAPPPDRREALGEQGVVLPGDGRCHVGRDDAGPDLVHDDPLGGEPDREELRGHAHPRLGHAVLTTVGGDGGGAGRPMWPVRSPCSPRGRRRTPPGRSSTSTAACTSPACDETSEQMMASPEPESVASGGREDPVGTANIVVVGTGSA